MMDKMNMWSYGSLAGLFFIIALALSFSGQNAVAVSMFLGIAVLCLFKMHGEKKKIIRQATANDPFKTRVQKKDELIAMMVRDGYQVDTDGDSFIQFRRPKKGGVVFSLVLFLVGAGLCFVALPLGGMVLVVWFISLFFANRPEVKTIPLTE